MSPATAEPEPRFVSTGSLPGRARVRALVDSCHAEYSAVARGRVSTVYPALAGADPDWFGLCLASIDGDTHEAGDARAPFTLMSVSKPFAFALACEELGVDAVRGLVGVNATGLPFNSLQAVDRTADGRTNPMVNAGAIATSSLAPGGSPAERWEFLQDGFSRFAGRRLSMDAATLESARTTNFRNRALAMLLADVDALDGDPLAAVDLYTRQCCLEVTAADIAMMGATLADGGVHPVTGRRVVSAAVARATLAVMSIAGLYESSGDWLLDVGFPGKSGISGGIVAVSPGKGALGVFSPPLDERGNSVRGQLVARRLARELGLDLLGSVPVGTANPPSPPA
ncbi:MAG: glutaminase A [Propionicimonas sp.]|nr:glutaminase A [Propionicimonas sp.]